MVDRGCSLVNPISTTSIALILQVFQRHQTISWKIVAICVKKKKRRISRTKDPSRFVQFRRTTQRKNKMVSRDQRTIDVTEWDDWYEYLYQAPGTLIGTDIPLCMGRIKWYVPGTSTLTWYTGSYPLASLP